MRGLKEFPHSCFSFLLQISSKPFSVKDDQLIQYLIPVPVSLRPLFNYVLTGKIQHLFQCRIAWEYAFRFCDFPILAVATVYKGNIIKNLIMDCQSYTKYRPNETTGGIFVSWRRKEELPTGA